MKLFLIFTLLMASVSSQAFTMNNSVKLVFAQNEVTVNVANGLCQNIGINEAELLSIVSDAVDRFWNTVPTSRLKLRKGSLPTVAGTFRTANICQTGTNCEPNPALAVSSGILVTCNVNAVNFTGSSVLAVTIPNNISGQTINGSLVMVNDQVSTQFKEKSRDEKVAIIAHELGHAFGLGHSPVTDSLMYYATRENRTSLGRDDMDGISYLYPKQQPKVGGCGTITFDKNRPDYWSGLFIGFLIIALAELSRKKLRPRLSPGT